MSEEAIDKVFAAHDKDGSGTLSPEEVTEYINAALKEMGVARELSADDVANILKEFDKNNDGSIGRAECLQIMQKVTGDA